jgi:threonyl-tRNA synthetase
VLGLEWFARLSFRDDSDKYLGDKDLWEKAQNTLTKVATDLKLEFTTGEGEAAFYGPKIDIMVRDGLGREWQCATQQLDFVQPERFNLKYTAEDGTEQTPVMIHKALLGSVERFMSVYIEHTAGRLPIWLSPEQVRIITVNQEAETVEFADKVLKNAKERGIRAKVDNSNESVGKKIREAEIWKVPYTIVLGEKEITSGKVTPRVRSDLVVITEHPELTIDDFFKTARNETKMRVQKTSL